MPECGIILSWADVYFIDTCASDNCFIIFFGGDAAVNFKTKDLARSAIFLALGLLIPYIFHVTGVPGQVFLPMHIPVLLCGLLLGYPYGLVVGLITPFLNTLLTGLPPVYPVAIAMAFELAAYGLVAGWLYKGRKMNLFLSLIIAMAAGRAVLGAVNFILLGMTGKQYGLQVFISSAFITALWGIIIQFIVIPLVVRAVEKNRE